MTSFVLHDRNWHFWSIEMKALLIKKRLWNPVTQRPLSATIDRQVSQGAQSELMLRVSDHFLADINEMPDAAYAWEALRRLFETQDASRRSHLKKLLNAIELDDDESMAQYVHCGRTLHDELRGAGSPTAHQEIVKVLIMGLPRAYDVFRKVLLASGDTSRMTLADLRVRQQGVESEYGREFSQENVKALLAKTKKFQQKDMSTVRCHYCRKLGQNFTYV